jgi:hypothetical protein
MDKQSDWASYGMMEHPFWKNGMTPEEYDTEWKYYHRHIEDWKNGAYLPLWKQKEGQ